MRLDGLATAVALGAAFYAGTRLQNYIHYVSHLEAFQRDARDAREAFLQQFAGQDKKFDPNANDGVGGYA